MDHRGRIAKVQEGLQRRDVDALLVVDLINVRYLTGFSGTNGQLLVSSDGAVFFSDLRYEARARDLVQVADVAIYPARLAEELAGRVESSGIRRLGIEASSMTIGQRDDLARDLPDVELLPIKDLVEGLRRVKDPDEIELIRQAVAVSDAAFELMLERLTPGLSERDVALDLEISIRKAGADDVSFEPIVGSGPLSAHIHHTPSERVVEKGDLVLLDFGSRWKGYCSDLTRTVVLGPASDEQRASYEVVLEAQRAGIAAARSGIMGREVDATARKVVEDAGHGGHFGHGLGHGVGLDIHEAPRLHRVSDDRLVSGNVVTIEPGIYVVGTGGIRVEDMVVITDEGCEVLGSAPKDALLEL